MIRGLLALAAALRREWRDQGRLMLLLCGGFALMSLALGAQNGREALPRTALVVALVAPFALSSLPAAVVDDAASGFVRLVTMQPLPRGAYATLRILATSTLLTLMLAPLVSALAFLDGQAIPRALATLALASVWSAAAAVLVGLLMRGPGAATATWVFVCVVNLLAVLASWPGMDMTDLLVRARHALPGAASVEALTPRADPWLWRAPVTLALEGALMTAGAIHYSARGWRHAEPAPGWARLGVGATFALALLVPFFLPVAPGGTR